MELLAIVLALFMIMDPIGNIGSFLSLLKGETPAQRNWIIVREMLFALAVMLLFNFIGEYLFNILSISEVTVRIASGIILFLIAIQILFPSTNSLRANLPKEKPFIIPLAIPLIVGPSVMATIMLFAHIEPSMMLMVEGIGIAWLLALVVLLFGSTLQRILGDNGLIACERLMGMILIMLAIQRFMEGIQLFVKSCA
jgi:multiple antibiotic resistance protein